MALFIVLCVCDVTRDVVNGEMGNYLIMQIDCPRCHLLCKLCTDDSNIKIPPLLSSAGLSNWLLTALLIQ